MLSMEHLDTVILKSFRRSCGEASLVSQCLPSKFEDLSLIPRRNTKKQDMEDNSCNPRVGEVDAGKPWESLARQSSLFDWLQAS